jgi:hypothetical protein
LTTPNLEKVQAHPTHDQLQVTRQACQGVVYIDGDYWRRARSREGRLAFMNGDMSTMGKSQVSYGGSSSIATHQSLTAV